jgi:hypothetical protein
METESDFSDQLLGRFSVIELLTSSAEEIAQRWRHPHGPAGAPRVDPPATSEVVERSSASS